MKGDLAQKISGALGISVQGDIVLQSDSKKARPTPASKDIKYARNITTSYVSIPNPPFYTILSQMAKLYSYVFQ